jgi:hypothetical protein
MTNPHTPSSVGVPRPSVTEVQQLVAGHLSARARWGYVLLLLVSLAVAVAIGSLWATEPTLPVRTQLAFAVIEGIAFGWVVFALWVLHYRRPLFGVDRVIAARMGLGFSLLGAAGMLGVGYLASMGRPAYVAAGIELGLAALAAGLLIRARRRMAQLQHRRQEIEGRLPVAERR